MGIAAYNRGSKVIRERLDREARPLPRPVRAPRPEPTPPPGDWKVGEQAFCKVHGSDWGWHTVTAIKDTGRNQRIKIQGRSWWCPVYNFSHEEVRT